MRQGRYLNVILTVNAILLAGLLWTQVADQPLLDSEATAQSRTVPKYKNSNQLGQPTFSYDIREINETNKEILVALKKLNTMLEGGLSVEVTNLEEIEVVSR